MKELLAECIKEIRDSKEVDSFGEEVTKQMIILKILDILGWDIHSINDIHPEYRVNGGKVDYCLKVNKKSRVLIEAKPVGKDLENDEKQLLDYAFNEGAELAVLTNGITWWFYLSLKGVKWEERRFYSIDIRRQDIEETASKFIDFLSKDNISTGKTKKHAENAYSSHIKETKIKDALLTSWNKIIEDIDEILFDLVVEKTRQITGYEPDSETVRKFITENKNQFLAPVILTSRETASKKLKKDKKFAYNKKKISAFYFQGVKYDVKAWVDMLRALTKILKKESGSDFDKILGLRFKKSRRCYFSRDESDLRKGEKVEKTNIFFETNLNRRIIKKICYKLLDIFGYPSKDLRIDEN